MDLNNNNLSDLKNIFDDEAFNSIVNNYQYDNYFDSNKVNIYLKETFKLLNEEKETENIENFKLDKNKINITKKLITQHDNIDNLNENNWIELEYFLENFESYESFETINLLLMSHKEKKDLVLILKKVINYHLKFQKIKKLFKILNKLNNKHAPIVLNSLTNLNEYKIDKIKFNKYLEKYIFSIKKFNKEIVNSIYEICKNNYLNNNLLSSISYIINDDLNLKNECIIKAIRLCNSSNLKLINKLYVNTSLFETVILNESKAIFNYLVNNKLEEETYRKGFSSISICIIKKPELLDYTLNEIIKMNEVFQKIYLEKVSIFYKLRIIDIDISTYYIDILYEKYDNKNEIYLKLINILIKFIDYTFPSNSDKFYDHLYDNLYNLYLKKIYKPIYEAINNLNTEKTIFLLKSLMKNSDISILFFSEMQNYDLYDLEKLILNLIFDEKNVNDLRIIKKLLKNIIKINYIDLNKISLIMVELLNEKNINYLCMYLIYKLGRKFEKLENIFSLLINLIAIIIEKDSIKEINTWKYFLKYFLFLSKSYQDILITYLPKEYKNKCLRELFN